MSTVILTCTTMSGTLSCIVTAQECRMFSSRWPSFYVIVPIVFQAR